MKNTAATEAFRDGLDAAGEKITRRAALDRATMMTVEDADAYLAGYDAGLRKPSNAANDAALLRQPGILP
jgi:hypothetical protein